MADEVIITELKKVSGRNGPTGAMGDIVTTQVLDIGTVSASLNVKTEEVLITSNTTGFWYRTGATAGLAASAANTDGNTLLLANNEHRLEAFNFLFIDTAADA